MMRSRAESAERFVKSRPGIYAKGTVRETATENERNSGNAIGTRLLCLSIDLFT
ncbi:MAG: hypothetical protein VKJ04_10325 [Vampirovibrionales bacterium]|nr:hypothetical protein [Vampirovibrionales bacterium]